MNMVISDYIVRQIMEDDERKYFLGMAKRERSLFGSTKNDNNV